MMNLRLISIKIKRYFSVCGIVESCFSQFFTVIHFILPLKNR
jgi:hypothetical protein